MPIERMLDKHVFGDDKETMWVRKDKNLLLRIHRQTQHLRSGNNPYPEDRPRSCGECPQTTKMLEAISIMTKIILIYLTLLAALILTMIFLEIYLMVIK